MKFLSKQAKPDALRKLIHDWFQGQGGNSRWKVDILTNREIDWWIAPTGDATSGDPNARQLIIINRWVREELVQQQPGAAESAHDDS